MKRAIAFHEAENRSFIAVHHSEIVVKIASFHSKIVAPTLSQNPVHPAIISATAVFVLSTISKSQLPRSVIIIVHASINIRTVSRIPPQLFVHASYKRTHAATIAAIVHPIGHIATIRDHITHIEADTQPTRSIITEYMALTQAIIGPTTVMIRPRAAVKATIIPTADPIDKMTACIVGERPLNQVEIFSSHEARESIAGRRKEFITSPSFVAYTSTIPMSFSHDPARLSRRVAL